MAGSRGELMVAIDDLLRGIFGAPSRRRPVDLDLTLGQLECLRLIGILGTPSMSELSSRLQLSPSTVTGLVDALVHRGKVERLPDPDDRRVVRAQLTDLGRREWEQHRERRRRYLLALLDELHDDDLRKLHEGLTALHAAAMRHLAREEREKEPDA
ncbi:MAG TPA: MarR family transcriptional regulator [Armatimonadota bacterium]|nr:MarR family transcriptional regulator [Armatimonadota bacterium]HOM82668.1 MarR family transcriptional regulator [Armatimonadota bacterium]HOQ30545.1 MarR family transcriptional regulator [Armatimonadota bacterium]HPO73429.1 MarR family transcriptional regulator [Armatimonadota bacterium]HPT99006.1 MarR family transcriptional regulator [Armatimonadota bacterium]